MEKELQTVLIAKTIKGTSFIAVRNYTNAKGEISNQTLLVGASYEKAKQYDLGRVTALDVESFSESSGFDLSTVIAAKESIIKSFTNPGKQSQSQKDAYTHITTGVKIHNDSGEIYLDGFVIAKKVIKAGEYKHVNSSSLTLCKKAITKFLDFKTAKKRSFCIGSAESIQLQGLSIK